MYCSFMVKIPQNTSLSKHKNWRHASLCEKHNHLQTLLVTKLANFFQVLSSLLIFLQNQTFNTGPERENY